METLNMKDNLLLRWRKPSRVWPRRRGAAFLLLPNAGAHLAAVADTVTPLVGRSDTEGK